MRHRRACSQHKLSTEKGVSQLSGHQEANVPSPSGRETHPLFLPIVSLQPEDVGAVAAAEIDEEAHPTPRQQQSLGQSSENPEDIEPSLCSKPTEGVTLFTSPASALRSASRLLKEE